MTFEVNNFCSQPFILLLKITINSGGMQCHEKIVYLVLMYSKSDITVINQCVFGFSITLLFKRIDIHCLNGMQIVSDVIHSHMLEKIRTLKNSFKTLENKKYLKQLHKNCTVQH